MKDKIYYKKSKRQITSKGAWKDCKYACTIVLFVNWAIFLFLGLTKLIPNVSYVKRYDLYLSLGMGVVMLLILVIGYYVNSEKKYEKWSKKRI